MDGGGEGGTDFFFFFYSTPPQLNSIYPPPPTTIFLKGLWNNISHIIFYFILCKYAMFSSWLIQYHPGLKRGEDEDVTLLVFFLKNASKLSSNTFWNC